MYRVIALPVLPLAAPLAADIPDSCTARRTPALCASASTPVARSAAVTREHVLEVANDLFYWNGIRATGIDRVAAEAAVAPATLYRLFGSKDDLIGAYIDRADRLYREWFNAAARAGGAEPGAQILAVFDALSEQVQPGQCRGCPFLMALAEFPDPDHPAHRNAAAVKAWVRARFGELTAAVAPGRAQPLADQLALVMEGVYASVQALGADGPARTGRAFAEALLGQAMPPPA
jgi:AcrR family transcriptional regulator